VGKIISAKKDRTIFTKAEKWAKPYQKLKQNHRHHFNKGYSKKKQENECEERLKINRNMKINNTVKRNMNMKKNINKCDLGRECGNVSKEE
jgi:hypothetical protein